MMPPSAQPPRTQTPPLGQVRLAVWPAQIPLACSARPAMTPPLSSSASAARLEDQPSAHPGETSEDEQETASRQGGAAEDDRE